jgi:hypothetical protein
MLDTSTQSVISQLRQHLRAWRTGRSSDLLVTEDQSLPEALLCPAEMRAIVATIVSETVPIEHRRAWRRGQQMNGRFKAQYRRNGLGLWRLWSLLWHFAGTRRNGGEQEWQAHMSVEPRDADGDVAIILSGGW